MSPKRKIPSRKLPSRKFNSAASRTSPSATGPSATGPAHNSPLNSNAQPSSQPTPKPKRKLNSKLNTKFNSKLNSKPHFKPNSSGRPASGEPALGANMPPPSVPLCFWDMGFESIPSVAELRQRYKELSLVLHPDAGGSKEAFLALRTNYETAQAHLEKR